MRDDFTPELLAGIDWGRDRSALGRMINGMMPVESLLPEIYAEWRPVVRDAVAYVGSHLSPSRLVPKLVRQGELPAGLPLAKRLIVLLEGMPSLQKLGQTVARNRNLDADFRRELIQLEDAMHEVGAEEIRMLIAQELGGRLAEAEVEIEGEILAEASVSAVIGFTWRDAGTGRRREGVFKVLKPQIRAHFAEELEILSGLAQHFDAHRSDYGLSEVNLSRAFEDVRRLLEREVCFTSEQANLRAAAARYANVRGVRVPQLIEGLCTPVVTAMSAERGAKVTAVYRGPGAQRERRRIATSLIEALVAIPLLSGRGEAVIHADPHAGNLLVDARTGDLLLVDWALTSTLSRPERRAILLLITAVTLRDRRLMAGAIAALCETEVVRAPEKASLVRGEVRRFVDGLSPFTMAGVSDALALVDRLTRVGIEFSSGLVVFRKMLFTLDGVLHDLVPGMRMDPTLAWYVARRRAASGSGLLRLAEGEADDFDFPLTGFDQFVAAWSAQFFWVRTALQTGRKIRRLGIRKLGLSLK